jgi:hypothetical protein
MDGPTIFSNQPFHSVVFGQATKFPDVRFDSSQKPYLLTGNVRSTSHAFG